MKCLPVRAVIVALAFSIVSARAATFSLLHSFGVVTNVTGLNPEAPLVQGPDGTLYGTTLKCEGTSRGVVFRVNPDGSGFAWLKLFSLINQTDGVDPVAGLALSGNVLYGVTSRGGSSGVGTVFSILTNGLNFTTLHTFAPTNGADGTNSDGAFPLAGLVVSNGMLYGTTFLGGTNGTGTVFALRTDGADFTTLHTFTADATKLFFFTNSDGAYPWGRLTLAGNTLFGTAERGGTNGYGTVFSLGTHGEGFTTVLNCDGAVSGAAYPEAGVLLSGSLLYGTSTFGGANNHGSVFVVATNGTGYTNLHSFGFNEGDSPQSDLVLSGGTLYGSAPIGGPGGGGVLFKVNVDGTGFTNFYNFTSQSTTAGGGYAPLSGLVWSNNRLYGTASDGGRGRYGTLFAIDTNGTGYTNLVSFGFSDAADPSSPLIVSGNRLYGTALNGGFGYGTVFALDTDGANYDALHAFTNVDGAGPEGLLLLSGSTLFGTTVDGGATNKGTIFALSTDGANFTNLIIFVAKSGTFAPNFSGADPFDGVVLVGDTLFGTASDGGTNGFGTVFSLQTNGTAFTTLHNFNPTNSVTGINSDGAEPQAGLLPLGDTLFGIASQGGANGFGSLFAIGANGGGFTNLHSFTGTDGAYPRSALVTDGSRLYGATTFGGAGSGVLFAMGTDGIGFTVLHTFSPTNGPAGTNGDGAFPFARLLLLGGKLYGAAVLGGPGGFGTIFSLNTDGSDFTTLWAFDFINGALPATGLTAFGNTLFGAAASGGPVGDGLIFALSLGPESTNAPLTVQLLGNDVVLTWNAPNASLQSSTNVTGVFGDIPGASSPYTNVITGWQRFYRLKAN